MPTKKKVKKPKEKRRVNQKQKQHQKQTVIVNVGTSKSHRSTRSRKEATPSQPLITTLPFQYTPYVMYDNTRLLTQDYADRQIRAPEVPNAIAIPELNVEQAVPNAIAVPNAPVVANAPNTKIPLFVGGSNASTNFLQSDDSVYNDTSSDESVYNTSNSDTTSIHGDSLLSGFRPLNLSTNNVFKTESEDTAFNRTINNVKNATYPTQAEMWRQAQQNNLPAPVNNFINMSGKDVSYSDKLETDNPIIRDAVDERYIPIETAGGGGSTLNNKKYYCNVCEVSIINTPYSINRHNQSKTHVRNSSASL